MKILIVDDSDFQRKVLATNLGKIGFSDVYGAFNYESAIEEFNKYSPDLVICDVMMPGKNGIVLTNALRARKPSLRAILITVLSTSEFENELSRMNLPKAEEEQAQMTTYLNKPYTLPELRKAITEAFK
ncbi:response regulator [Candidatus Woesearchaeota archaeon]|nr:response regulator [Candidatus Woesearchaeota archaeon]